MTTLQLPLFYATLTHVGPGSTVVLEEDVLRALLEAAWDEGNRRPRRDTNPYRRTDG